MPTLRLEADHGELKFRSPHLSMQIFGFGGMCGKSSHKVCGDLSRIGLENVFQRAAILGRASVSCFITGRFGFLETVTITIIISSRCGEHKEPECAMILPTHTGLVEIDTPSLYPIRISTGITINASFSIILFGKISTAISAAFSFVTASGDSVHRPLKRIQVYRHPWPRLGSETTQLTWLEPPAKRRRLMFLRRETVHRFLS